MSTQTNTGASGLDGFFKITERGSDVGREVRGGVVTFFTMGYIVVLNPLILGFVKDADGQYLGGGASPNLAAIAARLLPSPLPPPRKLPSTSGAYPRISGFSTTM